MELETCRLGGAFMHPISQSLKINIANNQVPVSDCIHSCPRNHHNYDSYQTQQYPEGYFELLLHFPSIPYFFLKLCCSRFAFFTSIQSILYKNSKASLHLVFSPYGGASYPLSPSDFLSHNSLQNIESTASTAYSWNTKSLFSYLASFLPMARRIELNKSLTVSNFATISSQ